ncbi:MAG: META domain-containing protein [Alcanivorax sp.]|nr:META domain-containing protein [Alcanivorax sp.]
MPVRFALLAVSALVLNACSASQPATPTPPISDEELGSDIWKVQRLNGQAVDDATLTLNFHGTGKLAGKAACNGYTGQYDRIHGQFHIKVGGVTMMACATPLMALEKQFLDTLSVIHHASLDKDGRLILSGGQGLRIQATR